MRIENDLVREDVVTHGVTPSSVAVVWWSWAVTAFLVTVAIAVAYLGIATAATIVSANEDAKAVVGASGYLAAGVVFPLVLGWHDKRKGSRSWEDALRLAAGFILLVHLVLVPIPLAVFAM